MALRTTEHSSSLLDSGNGFRGGCILSNVCLSMALAILGSNIGLAQITPAGQNQPTFTQTGSMSTPRWLHTATRLNDGRVLVVGGYDAEGRTLASAEIYNPSTGSWSNTGGLSYARTDHQAVLLNSGKVLVFGGFDSATEQSLLTAELYDPSTGIWATTGPMTFGRRLFASTKLADGEVLAVGGYLGNQNLASAEKYDPASGTWSQAGNMLTARRGHTATLLNDGRVLVDRTLSLENTCVDAQ